MAFTFLKAQGHEIGKSLLDEESLDYARRVLADAGAKLVLPVDVVVAPELSPEAPVRVVAVNQIPADQLGADIGPETARLFGEIVHDAKTTIWNGPMGVFEMEPFAGGTRLLLQALAESNGTTILGGGDTAAAAEIMGFADKMTHVSTGGGATLELLEGKVLPGVAALMDA
jgi:phosphoglycerate kinase